MAYQAPEITRTMVGTVSDVEDQPTHYLDNGTEIAARYVITLDDGTEIRMNDKKRDEGKGKTPPMIGKTYLFSFAEYMGNEYLLKFGLTNAAAPASAPARPAAPAAQAAPSNGNKPGAMKIDIVRECAIKNAAQFIVEYLHSTGAMPSEEHMLQFTRLAAVGSVPQEMYILTGQVFKAPTPKAAEPDDIPF